MSSNSTAVTQLGASYELLVGPLLIGVVLNALVFGVCCMQLISYFLAGYQDGWKMIALLGWVYIIDTFQVGSSISMMWHYVVTNFANPVALAFSPWEYATLPIFSSLASVPIQHFMAYRIMRFSGSNFLFGFISLLSWAQAALGITSAIKGVLNPTIESHRKIIPYADAWLALSAACDLCITVLLLYYLLRSRTGFERTDSIISTICVTTVKAAVPVTVLCLLDLTFLTALPNNNLHYMCALPVGRLYTNTLMSTLNDRKHLRSQMENSTPNRAISLTALTTSKTRFQVQPAQVRINIEHDTDVAGVDPSSFLATAKRTSFSPHSLHHSSYSPQQSPSHHPNHPSRHWSMMGRGGMDLGLGLDADLKMKYEDDTGDSKYDNDNDIDIEEVDGGDSKASPIAESPSDRDGTQVQRVVVANLPNLARTLTRTREDGSGMVSVSEESEGGVKFERVGYGF